MLRPVKASGWFDTIKEQERETLIKTGIIPVNDIFYPLWNNTNKINLLFGGYGSGKSVFIAQELLRCAKESKYFRGYYGRKVLEDVRGSVHATLCDVIEDFKLDNEFKYSREPHGSMVIRHYNGNTLLPFGASDSKSLKSIKDPTHFWCEEFDQFTENQIEPDKGDFAMIYPRLRTTKAITQFYGSFNTSAVYQNHWILKYFFPELLPEKDRPRIDILENVSISKCFANYYNNHFIDQEAYYNQLKLASGGNTLLLEAIANGAWGMIENKNPWLYSFDPTKHLCKLEFLPSFPVYLSFDFNNDPFACVAFQFLPNLGHKSAFVHFIKEFSGMVKLEEMCQRIKMTYPSSIIFVTGDRSGNNEDIGRNQTLYEMIQSLLSLSSKQMYLNTHNLEHADSRILCNIMFSHYPNVFIDPIECPNLTRQCQAAAVDIEAPKASHLLKDRAMHKNDEFDGMRYAFQTFFNKFVRETYLKILKK